MKKLVLALLLLGIFAGCDQRPDKYEWKLVASPGRAKIVYLAPEGFADEAFVSELLGYLVDKSKINKVLLFDSMVGIPTELPITDPEKIHWKAQYEFNPVTGYERYDSVHIVNAKSKPIEVYLEKESIAPAP